MYIIAELFDFIEKVIVNVELSKQCSLYKLIDKIIHTNPDNCNLAVPAFILFDSTNSNYIEIIQYDHITYNPVYDENIECFVFKGVNNLFFGIKEILKKIHAEYPNDCIVMDNLNKIQIFLKLVKGSMEMDDLCDILNASLNIKI